RAICTQVQPPAWMNPAWPTSRARAMPGSTVQACCTREDPSSPHMPPITLVAVSTIRRGPASSRTGWGEGGRSSQMPTAAGGAGVGGGMGGGGDPIAVMLGGGKALPGLGGHLYPDPQASAALIQRPQWHLARDGRVVVAGEQDRPGLGAGAGGGAGDQLGQGE